MIDAPLSSELVGQAINFHGQQLQKIWEGERGEADLSNMAIKLDFNAFQHRQKTLNFQDRGKRLKLQQFIVKRANTLFDLSFTEGHSESRKAAGEEECYAALPPYETFLQVDRPSRVRHFFQNVKLGNIVIGTILSKNTSGLVLKVLSLEEDDRVRYVSDLQIKAFCPVASLIPAVDKKKVARTYMLNDAVCCEVIEVVPEADKLVLGMKGAMLPPGSDQHSRLGLIFSEDFPDVFRRVQDRTDESYDALLKRNVVFNNPGSINYLAQSMGMSPTKNYTNVPALRARFPEQEYATELRQVQASKWAFRSVADGIEHFKAGRHTEAFQCLNKALEIDPRNLEGLVARGALYANSGNFNKAIDDFETSLKLNPNHQNARKYMGETLVALGRSHEDEGKLDDALKAYEKCLSIVPYHEEANNSMQYIKKKMTDITVLPGFTPSKTLEVKETLKQLLKSEQEEDDAPPQKREKDRERKSRKKKKDRKSRKRRRRSSSSSSSSSSDSSASSSSSSTTSSSSSGSSHSGSSHSRSRSRSRKDRKKHRKSKSKSKGRDKSLSPLSKRMSLMDSNEPDGVLSLRQPHYNPPLQSSALPYFYPGTQMPPQPALKEPDYEIQVRKFLEQTKGDLEYEEKVRKFLEETERWRKEKKAGDDKASRKKKKKEKKSHEKSKKKKRDREERKKHKKNASGNDKSGDKSDTETDITQRKFDALLARRMPKHIVDEEEEFLYGPAPGAAQAREMPRETIAVEKSALKLLPLDSLKGLDDLESKLNAYYAKLEKDTGISKRSSSKSGDKSGKDKMKSGSPKPMHDDKLDDSKRLRDKKGSLSPPRSSGIMSPMWKMQIPSVGSALKRKENKLEANKEAWDDPDDKRFKNDSKLEDEYSRKMKQPSQTPSSARKLGDRGKSEENKPRGHDDGRDMSPDLRSKDAAEPIRGRRSLRRNSHDSDSRSNSSHSETHKEKKKDLRRSRSRSSSSSRSRSRGRKYSRASSVSSSRSANSYKKKRVDRSHSPAQAKKSGSPDRERDRYRSRSRSYKDYRSSASRSRSRSHDRRSYYSRSRSYDRSRSRSREYRRSRSPDRRRDYHNKYQGRFPRQRGTYYRPRFQNYKNPRGNFGPRGGRNFYPKYNPQNRGRGFVPRQRGRGRGRFNYKPGFNRDYRNYDRRNRSRDRDSPDRASSYEDDPMRKVNAEKDRINKYIEERGNKEGERERKSPRRSEPLSEGEERDEDYGTRPEGSPPENRNFRGNHWKHEGKWADKEKDIEEPAEDGEDMDKFFSKVKASKELKERKSVSKW